MCKFDIKIIRFFKKNIKYIFIPIVPSLIAGFILYNIQIMFETTTKQIEYFEKIKQDTELLFMEKYQLNNEKIENLFLLLKETRNIFYDTINNNKNEEKILFEYLNNIEEIYDKKLSPKYLDKETLEIEKEIKIGFLNEKIYNNIILLKIYSNDSLNSYEEKLEKQFKSLDNLYLYLITHMQNSIYNLTNKTYIIQNLRTREDFNKLLISLNSNELEKSLKKITEDNNKISMEIKKLEINVMNEINNRINGNIFGACKINCVSSPINL